MASLEIKIKVTPTIWLYFLRICLKALLFLSKKPIATTTINGKKSDPVYSNLDINIK